MTQPIRVLLADDEVVFAESLAKVLRKRGLLVELAHDGAAALAAVAQQEFDVIVLDVRMPVSDGISTLRGIRTRDRLTPVLMLSGHADLGRTAEALQAGATDFLLKPCDLELLHAALVDAAERKHYAVAMAAQQRE